MFERKRDRKKIATVKIIMTNRSIYRAKLFIPSQSSKERKEKNCDENLNY